MGTDSQLIECNSTCMAGYINACILMCDCEAKIEGNKTPIKEL